jgi:hypothetical protein
MVEKTHGYDCDAGDNVEIIEMGERLRMGDRSDANSASNRGRGSSGSGSSSPGKIIKVFRVTKMSL